MSEIGFIVLLLLAAAVLVRVAEAVRVPAPIVLVVGGLGIALIPGLPHIQLLVAIQTLNGILLPIILVFMLLLINDRRLVGDLKNSRLYNVLGWGTFALVATAVAVLLGTQLLGLFGVDLLGG